MKIVQIQETERGMLGLDEDGGLWRFHESWEPKVHAQGCSVGWTFICSSEARSVVLPALKEFK